MLNIKFNGSIAIITLLLTAPVSAQTSPSSWDTIKALAAATEVRVTTASGSDRGTVESASDTELSLRMATGQRMFARQDIRSVSVHNKGHRVRNTLIGLGVGTGVGMGIGAGVGHANDCKTGFLCGLNTAVGVALGGAIGLVGGAAIGALWHAGGWMEIYHS
jgi:hypothetical protein